MRQLFSFFLLGLAVTSCQNDVTHPVVANSNEKTNICSSTSKVIRVPQEFQTIEEALAATAPPTTRLVIQVSYKTGGYLLKDGLTVDRPCTDLIGRSRQGGSRKHSTALALPYNSTLRWSVQSIAKTTKVSSRATK